MNTFELRRFTTGVITFLLVLIAAVVPGQAKEKDQCEGKKKQRRQKMELRDISKDQFLRMLDTYSKEADAERVRIADTILRRLERKYDAHLKTGAPFDFEILILSGGGAKGAFGAGFLQGWGAIPPGPHERPDFDMVTGVSTGALISPYATIGTDEAYASIVDFYANPDKNWVKKRGVLYFEKGHASLFNNCHLQEMIRDAVTEPLVRLLADAAEEDRLLLIGTANLDAGAGHVFDLGWEARNALESGSIDRVHSILLASSAIPGIFPPIEIGGMLYADGGAASNLFLTGFSRVNGPIARFREKHPEAPTPMIRVWIVVNGRLQPEPSVTQPRWESVSESALGVLMSTSELFALELINTLVYEARVERGIEAEFRLTSIPSDAVTNKTDEMFDQDYMVELENLGRTLGADPTSWTSEIPSPFWRSGN